MTGAARRYLKGGRQDRAVGTQSVGTTEEEFCRVGQVMHSMGLFRAAPKVMLQSSSQCFCLWICAFTQTLSTVKCGASSHTPRATLEVELAAAPRQTAIANDIGAD